MCRFADWQTCAEVLNRTLDSVAHVDGERMRWIRGEYLVDGGLYMVVAALEEENQTRECADVDLVVGGADKVQQQRRQPEVRELVLECLELALI